jgi:hypothetical protein
MVGTWPNGQEPGQRSARWDRNGKSGAPAPRRRETRNDRSAFLAHAERQEGNDPARGVRPALQDHPLQYPAGRAVQARVSRDEPEPSLAGHPDRDLAGGGDPITTFGPGAIMGYLAGESRALPDAGFGGKYRVTRRVVRQMANRGRSSAKAGISAGSAIAGAARAMPWRGSPMRPTGLYGVPNNRLYRSRCAAGDEHTIADIVNHFRTADSLHVAGPAASPCRTRAAPHGVLELENCPSGSRVRVRSSATIKASLIPAKGQTFGLARKPHCFGRRVSSIFKPKGI